MLEIRLVGPSPGTPHQRSYRESMSFTSLELETKSYTKILKNKKVRAENILGGSLESPQSRMTAPWRFKSQSEPQSATT